MNSLVNISNLIAKVYQVWEPKTKKIIGKGGPLHQVPKVVHFCTKKVMK